MYRQPLSLLTLNRPATAEGVIDRVEVMLDPTLTNSERPVRYEMKDPSPEGRIMCDVFCCRIEAGGPVKHSFSFIKSILRGERERNSAEPVLGLCPIAWQTGPGGALAGRAGWSFVVCSIALR
jgi:hypothetical protein